MPRSWPPARDARLRSGLEDALAAQLAERGLDPDAMYETISIPFRQPEKPRAYRPDYVLPNGIVIEAKGRFVTADRQKHVFIRAQYPDLDVRFVFSNSRTRISKQSATTYAAWCAHKGFLYADREIPDAWLDAPRNAKSQALIRRFIREGEGT